MCHLVRPRSTSHKPRRRHAAVLDALVTFDVPVPLRKERAELVLRIVLSRRRLLQELVDAHG